MKKIALLLLTFQLLTFNLAKADEGMWLPMLLKNNYEQMQKLGLKLTPEQLYDINHASLKDAIVWFNGGCTSEIISEQGLLLTNHHCGYDAIAKHSTTSDNLLDNGFWARSFAEEKVNEGMWASILIRMEDVSDRVNKALAGVDAKDLEAKKMEIFKTIEKESSKDTKYEAMVRSFFKDNAFYLFIFEKFTDVRLVAAPPQSVGKFGGEVDNWMWPRHNADFSMFRIYANKDNQPATYSKDNVPYKPKQFLNVSIKGVNDGDFTMIYGFPGRTNRYENSFGIKLAVDKINPAIVALRDIRLTYWKQEMNKSDSVRLLMSSQYAKISNYWKYYIGQTEQLKRLKVYDEKVSIEKQFTDWAKNKPEYASIIPNFEKAYANYTNYALHATYMRECIFGSSIIATATKYTGLERALSAEPQNIEAIKKAIDALKSDKAVFYKSFNVVSEEKILAALIQMYYENIPANQHPAYMAEVLKKYKGKTNKETFENFAKAIFKKSFLVSNASASKFLDDPSLKQLEKDPAFAFARAFYTNYNKNIMPHIDEFNLINNMEGSKYIKALMEMQSNKSFSPDANSTLRLTYGNVKSYIPKDGVNYSYYTTLAGVMEKENPKDFQFIVPAKLKELYIKKDFGIYADANGEMRTDFITNNDITGGNSGSPVLDGNGDLVGLAFDGNWEAMSGDIVFDSKYKRTICVDIRYILFLTEKLGGAQNLINEMKIIKN
ncbi:MAG: peptidase S46 [Bacteroidetes bacterium RIFCSPLOWO2_12_FULL_35_15]|nr:MAG: peptidase S46 [Bacteroidetes bacterium RIFCSPLOWO2_12_FULL_35_15]